MAKLNWSLKASNDLEEIAEYIIRDSLKAAQPQIDFLVERSSILERFPKIGRMVPELKDSRYRQTLEGLTELFTNF